MGSLSSQEKNNVQNLAGSKEGESIVEISNSSLEQDIYIRGNYDMDLFKNKIINSISDPKKPNVKYYEKIAKHKEISDWHFFFAPKEKNFDEMIENVKKYIEDHLGFEDFDDFNEGSKTRTEKSVILYFIDDNKENFINYFIQKHNSLLLPLFVIIGNKSENDELKKYINKAIKELKGNRIIDPNIFKFCDFSENTDNNLINLNFNLIECSAYFNELGDEYKYPNQFMDDKLFDKVVEEIIKNFSTLNILICGRPGVGKSTFINGILKTTISRSKKGEECSKRIIKYIHRTYPIAFYDSPGMSTNEIMERIIELIEKKNNELGKLQSKIHAVFYLFNGKNVRFFEDKEFNMLKLILSKFQIPLYLLATQFKSKEEYEENKMVIIKNYYNVTKNIQDSIKNEYKKENIVNNIFCVNMIGDRYSEADKLFEKMYDDFKKYIVYDTITKNNIEQYTGDDYLISKLKNPQDIIPHPIKLCEQINLTYRLIARSISADKNGSTLLSISMLRIIGNIFCKEKLSSESCKVMITAADFDLDEKDRKKKKEYKHWLKNYYGYQTPAEEQISYIADKYTNLYSEELKSNNENCLKYINLLQQSLNNAIEGLLEISKEYKN